MNDWREEKKKERKEKNGRRIKNQTETYRITSDVSVVVKAVKIRYFKMS